MKGYFKIFIFSIISSLIAFLIYAAFFNEKEELSPVPNNGIQVQNQR